MSSVQKGQRNTERRPRTGGRNLNQQQSERRGGEKIFINCGQILGLNIKLHSKISESATSSMNRGTPYAGSAIEADDQIKSRTRRSRNRYTHCANERGVQSRHSNERKIQGKHIKQAHGERKRVITWGDEGARRSGGEPPARNADPGRGRGRRTPPRFRRGGVGSGARLRSPRGGLPVSVACVACRAHLPSSQSQLRCCRVGRGPARLDWIGLDWTGLPPLHCPLPCRFSPLRTSPPLLLLRGLFFSFGISPPSSRPLLAC